MACQNVAIVLHHHSHAMKTQTTVTVKLNQETYTWCDK